MTRLLASCSLFLTAVAFSPLMASPAPVANSKPNIVLIFADDMGYGDIGAYGSTKIRTPHIDRLAAEGRRFTSFVVASSVCSPSRAALLTGSYPKRVSMHEGVLYPSSPRGLNPSEHTIAEHLKPQGYATACIGKWHLGDDPETMPTAQGFDTYFGIPYSNDMNHPDNKGKPPGKVEGLDALWNDPESTLTKWKTPLMRGTQIIEMPVDQRTITRRSTDEAIGFMTKNRGRPFFLYLPYSMPHIPLYVPDDVRDPDPKRAYINTVEHLDTELGRLFAAIRTLELVDNTYVILTSDNGPWLAYRHHGGSAGPLRGGKTTTFEGGQRVPFIVWSPGRVPAGTECDALTSAMDILPSVAALTRTPLPADRTIDGLDISPLFAGSDSPVRDEFLYYSQRGRLEGIRVGDWKLLQRVPNNPKPGEAAEQPETLLFHLAADLGEKNNRATERPDLVAVLTTRMFALDASISAEARPDWKRR
jgi:arylsulfatase A-like enzyme